jgi:hypothetical protein
VDRGDARFFRLGLAHSTLEWHYRLALTMKRHFDWGFDEQGEMYPYEFEVYAIILQQQLREEEEKKRNST